MNCIKMTYKCDAGKCHNKRTQEAQATKGTVECQSHTHLS